MQVEIIWSDTYIQQHILFMLPIYKDHSFYFFNRFRFHLLLPDTLLDLPDLVRFCSETDETRVQNDQKKRRWSVQTCFELVHQEQKVLSPSDQFWKGGLN